MSKPLYQRQLDVLRAHRRFHLVCSCGKWSALSGTLSAAMQHEEHLAINLAQVVECESKPEQPLEAAIKANEAWKGMAQL